MPHTHLEGPHERALLRVGHYGPTPPLPPRLTLHAPAALPYAALLSALSAARDRGVRRVTVVVTCPSIPHPASFKHATRNP